MIMDAPLNLVVALGVYKGLLSPNIDVTLRSVTPPRRRTLLAHGGVIPPGTSAAVPVDFPWVGESLETVVYERYVGTHVLLFESDPRLIGSLERVPCWNAGSVFGHGLGTAMACLGYADSRDARSRTFWNTSFHTVYVGTAVGRDSRLKLERAWAGWARRA